MFKLDTLNAVLVHNFDMASALSTVHSVQLLLNWQWHTFYAGFWYIYVDHVLSY